MQCQEGCLERHHRLLHAVETPPVPAAEPLAEVPKITVEPMPVPVKTPEDPMPMPEAKVQVHGGVASLSAMVI